MRLPKAERRAELLDAALHIAERIGADKVTHDLVAQHAEVTRTLVIHYFGTAPQLRRDIMRAAVKRRIVPIVARGIALRDAHALKADDALRALALAHLARA